MTANTLSAPFTPTVYRMLHRAVAATGRCGSQLCRGRSVRAVGPGPALVGGCLGPPLLHHLQGMHRLLCCFMAVALGHVPPQAAMHVQGRQVWPRRRRCRSKAAAAAGAEHRRAEDVARGASQGGQREGGAVDIPAQRHNSGRDGSRSARGQHSGVEARACVCMQCLQQALASACKMSTAAYGERRGRNRPGRAVRWQGHSGAAHHAQGRHTAPQVPVPQSAVGAD